MMNLSEIQFPVVTVYFDSSNRVFCNSKHGEASIRSKFKDMRDHRTYLTRYSIHDSGGNTYRISRIEVKKRTGLLSLLGKKVEIDVEKTKPVAFEVVRNHAGSQLLRLASESGPEHREGLMSGRATIMQTKNIRDLAHVISEIG